MVSCEKNQKLWTQLCVDLTVTTLRRITFIWRVLKISVFIFSTYQNVITAFESAK